MVQATEGKLEMPGFSQEFGTAGTKKSCRCGRKIFTALPTIKSSERGDLCIWDKGGDPAKPLSESNIWKHDPCYTDELQEPSGILQSQYQLVRDGDSLYAVFSGVVRVVLC